MEIYELVFYVFALPENGIPGQRYLPPHFRRPSGPASGPLREGKDRKRTRERSAAFPLFPQPAHILQGFAFGFGHILPDEQGGEDADRAVKAVCDYGAEAVERGEGVGDQEIEDPLEGNGESDGLAADGVGEDFGDQHPTDRAPGHHKGCCINDNSYYRQQASDMVVGQDSHGKSSDGHSYRADNKQRFTPHFFHRENGNEGKDDIDDSHNDRLCHAVGSAS